MDEPEQSPKPITYGTLCREYFEHSYGNQDPPHPSDFILDRYDLGEYYTEGHKNILDTMNAKFQEYSADGFLPTAEGYVDHMDTSMGEGFKDKISSFVSRVKGVFSKKKPAEASQPVAVPSTPAPHVAAPAPPGKKTITVTVNTDAQAAATEAPKDSVTGAPKESITEAPKEAATTEVTACQHPPKTEATETYHESKQAPTETYHEETPTESAKMDAVEATDAFKLPKLPSISIKNPFAKKEDGTDEEKKVIKHVPPATGGQLLEWDDKDASLMESALFDNKEIGPNDAIKLHAIVTQLTKTNAFLITKVQIGKEIKDTVTHYQIYKMLSVMRHKPDIKKNGERQTAFAENGAGTGVSSHTVHWYAVEEFTKEDFLDVSFARHILCDKSKEYKIIEANAPTEEKMKQPTGIKKVLGTIVSKFRGKDEPTLEWTEEHAKIVTNFMLYGLSAITEADKDMVYKLLVFICENGALREIYKTYKGTAPSHREGFRQLMSIYRDSPTTVADRISSRFVGDKHGFHFYGEEELKALTVQEYYHIYRAWSMLAALEKKTSALLKVAKKVSAGEAPASESLELTGPKKLEPIERPHPGEEMEAEEETYEDVVLEYQRQSIQIFADTMMKRFAPLTDKQRYESLNLIENAMVMVIKNLTEERFFELSEMGDEISEDDKKDTRLSFVDLIGAMAGVIDAVKNVRPLSE